MTNLVPVAYVIGYKNQERLDRCVRSIWASDPDVHVVVVNNGPTPLTIPEGRPATGTRMDEIIAGPGNGFTGGANAALQHSRTYWGGYDSRGHNGEPHRVMPVLLNDDLVLHEGCIGYLLATLQENPQVGMVAPMQTAIDNSSYLICGGFGKAYPAGEHEAGHKDDPRFARERACKWLTFAAVAIRPELIDAIGLLDETMPMYFSDSDYSMRATSAGWKLLLTPRALVGHENHAATHAEFDEKLRYRLFVRDQAAFEYKWSGGILSGVSHA
jgi:GT2 family glycosyltransferase